MNTTRAFLIIFVIITLFAQMVNITSQYRYNKKVRRSSGSIFTVAGNYDEINLVSNYEVAVK